MLIALTAYFYFFAVASLLVWVYSLFQKPSLKDRVEGVENRTDKAVMRGCIATLAPVILALLAFPLVYLQLAGLEALGLPAWLAWVSYGATIISGFASAVKPKAVSGSTSGLPVFGYFLAWYGLTVLQAAANG